jgi:Relaxase/Mobilisation nuclease domain
MVAVIKTGHSISRTLNYNEKKVKEGVAEIISAANYPMDVEQLSFENKLNRLENQAALNENVSRKSVHISLNFDPSEKLSKERLQEIADTYMQKIGFGEQPYLVYQHFDSGHPHIHIVSVKVRADGSRIDTQNIGRNQSEKARKEIEISYGLVKAQDSRQRAAYRLEPVNIQRAKYGRSETKRAITNVLDQVIKNYKFTSLPELNAVLKQYNVIADQGSENSRVFKNKGLTYRIIDEQGNKIGVPIKASDFYNKPTLNFLEEKFSLNEADRHPHKARVKNAIDFALFRETKLGLESLMESLEKRGINTVLRQNNDGIIYGITYVDHQTKCVFNGSILGKQYSANGILERCGMSSEQTAQRHEFVQQSRIQNLPESPGSELIHQVPKKEGVSILETLLKPEYTSAYVPNQLTKNSRKKKKKRISNRL